jgi:hypothetical protein
LFAIARSHASRAMVGKTENPQVVTAGFAFKQSDEDVEA